MAITTAELSRVRGYIGDTKPPYAISTPVIEALWVDADKLETDTLATVVVWGKYLRREHFLSTCGEVTEAVERRLRLMDASIRTWEKHAGMDRSAVYVGTLDLDLDYDIDEDSS